MSPRDRKTGGSAGATAAGPSAPARRSRLRTIVRRGRGEGGQAILEFAMVLPLIALVAFVLISFGKAIWVYIEVTHAANEGARLASVNQPQDTSLQSYLTSEYALPSGASIAICYPDGSAENPRAVGEPVQVVVYTNASWVPIVNIGQIKGAATMRLEQDTSGNSELNGGGFDSSTGLCHT